MERELAIANTVMEKTPVGTFRKLDEVIQINEEQYIREISSTNTGFASYWQEEDKVFIVNERFAREEAKFIEQNPKMDAVVAKKFFSVMTLVHENVHRSTNRIRLNEEMQEFCRQITKELFKETPIESKLDQVEYFTSTGLNLQGKSNLGYLSFAHTLVNEYAVNTITAQVMNTWGEDKIGKLEAGLLYRGFMYEDPLLNLSLQAGFFLDFPRFAKAYMESTILEEISRSEQSEYAVPLIVGAADAIPFLN